MDLGTVLALAGDGAAALAQRLSAPFTAPGALSSAISLGAALAVAAAYLAARRLRRGRRIRVRALARALFRTFRWRPSQQADAFYFILNTFLLGAVLGGALLSLAAVSEATVALLSRLLGPAPAAPLPDVASRVIVTVAMFLAYELGYWVDHWLSHRVPVLWDFHKVHHGAEDLTPLTAWRVHPIETLKFANILALFTGVVGGISNYWLGGGVHEYALTGTNLILVGFIYAYVHLQHTHLWIAFTGIAGRLLQSPAHHQIHHSSDRAHHNRNFGSCLAVWDWLFGTLHVPSREPERLHFGIDRRREPDHSLLEILVRPFVQALARVPRILGRARPPAGAERAVETA